MSSLDLHPEELLERAHAGTLSDEERAHLDAHLSQCAVCRFELQAKQDFAALPQPALAVDDLVSRALAGLPQPHAEPARRPRRRYGAYLAAAALLSGMMSFAAVYRAELLPVVKAVLGLAAQPEPAPAPPSVAHHRAHPAPAPQPAPAPEPAVEPSAPTPEPEASAAPPPPLHGTPARHAAPQPEPQVTATLSTPPLPPPEDAASLFRRASSARARGDYGQATALYRELAERFPASEEAAASSAVFGRLLLDRGEPAQALSQFDWYLTSQDAGLVEEVLVGRASALDKLGRSSDEAQAWETLLSRFPNSVHAQRARERLSTLRDP